MKRRSTSFAEPWPMTLGTQEDHTDGWQPRLGNSDDRMKQSERSAMLSGRRLPLYKVTRRISPLGSEVMTLHT